MKTKYDEKTTLSLWQRYHLAKNSGTDEEIKVRNLLIEKHLYILDFIAERMNRTFPPSVTFDDCYQAGYFGLLSAVQGFDPNRNVSFMRYASIRIRGSILDYIRSIDPLSRQTRSLQSKFNKCAKQLEIELGRRPTDDEIIDKLGITYKEFSMVTNKIASSQALSIHEIDDSDTTVGLIDMLSNCNAVNPSINIQKEEYFNEILSCFNEKEVLVLTLYYREMLSLKEIGAVMDLSESRVSQVKSDVMKKLKNAASTLNQA